MNALHSAKPTVGLLFEALEARGIYQWVFSPGSRNAPLVMEAHARDAKTHMYTIPDERVAGFFALGLALQSNKPVVLCCTSGSAVVNYYPAVVEAYYQRVPLIVVSADRPAEWIDQGDGQTIRQVGVFANHQAKDVALKGESYTESEVKDLLDCLDTTLDLRQPVHINMSFEEPLYETVRKPMEVVIPPRQKPIDASVPGMDQALEAWKNAQKRWILVGQLPENHGLDAILQKLANHPSVVLLSETTSNLSHRPGFHAIDRMLATVPPSVMEQAMPDALLTLGGAVISKKIKALLRKHKPAHHIQVQPWPDQADTYRALNHPLTVNPMRVLEHLETTGGADLHGLLKPWVDQSEARTETYAEIAPFSDWKVFWHLSKNVPEGVVVHAGNSSVVRYLQLFDQPLVPFYGNRGTSGIDGSLSTAVGFAQNDARLHLAIVGDLSFAYDSNALFHNHLPPNLRILLVNNGGGGIFRIIDGPATQPEVEAAFVAKTPYRASGLAQAFGADYLWAEDEASLLSQWPRFMGPSPRPVILEVVTPEYENHLVLNDYFKYLSHVSQAQLDTH